MNVGRPLAAAMLFLAGVLSVAGGAGAFTPCIVYTEAGKFDKSYNEGAFLGVQRFARETGIAVREFEPASPDAYEAGLNDAASSGCTDLVVIGFRFAEVLDRFAAGHGGLRFTIIDGIVERPNVASVLFAENEGAYLAGVAAAMSTRTGKLGFVGGMAVDVIHRFQAGFAQGIRDTAPSATLLVDMVADGPAGFADPFTGSERAREMMGAGADLIFPAAGASGLGAIHAAAVAGRLSIGVDSNQNYLYPGRVLTSVVKRIDVAVERAFQAGRSNAFVGGGQVLGLKDGAVDVAVDEHNAQLWTDAIRTAVERARGAIIAGRLRVDGADAVKGS